MGYFLGSVLHESGRNLVLHRDQLHQVLAALLLAFCLLLKPVACHTQQASGLMPTLAHTPMSTLLFKTPACAYPPQLQQRRNRISPVLAAQRPVICDRELCSLDRAVGLRPATFGSLPHARKRSRQAVKAQALSLATETKTEKWWKKQSELWVEIETEEQFQREISTGDKFVFVDFYATWCNGCQRSYPELCKLAADPEIAKNFKFVKVCIEALKKVANGAGVKALPYAQIYKPGLGKVAAIDIPPSRMKHLRHNLVVIVGNPNRSFMVDPNGFVIPGAPLSDAVLKAQEAAKREAASTLESSTGSLFDHLMKDVLGAKPAAPAVPAAAPVPVPAAAVSVPAVAVPAAAVAAVPSGDAELDRAKADFLEAHGKEYGYAGQIDALYPCEVGCRMKPDEHYMDYTGSSVYCQSQLEQVFQELRSHMYGNPHSANPSSSLTEERVEEVRDMVLRYFNADPNEYQVVFTRSATGALQLVGETFPWKAGSTFAYLRENHNSVLGMREYALEKGGHFQAVNETFVEAWVGNHECDAGVLERLDNSAVAIPGADPVYNLFAFPAEDNFAGVKYPLRWVQEIKAKSTSATQWKVLLDAAAYVPTQPLDLSEVPADFVVMSFYKMFGYPTGLGALLVRVEAAGLLQKHFWGGGTVSLATSSDNFHVLKCRPADKLEDGTVNFLDIIALKHGFHMFQRLGGVKAIQSHVTSLTQYLYGRLSKMKHSNGRPMLEVFGKHDQPDSRDVQGGILNFELLKPNGGVLSYKTFEMEAAEAGFHVRTGAACNPGACYAELGVQESEIEGLAGKKEGCHDDVEFITVERSPAMPSRFPVVKSSDEVLKPVVTSSIDLGHPAEVATQWVDIPLGSVRVSLGYMSRFEDCYALARFIEAKYKDREQ